MLASSFSEVDGSVWTVSCGSILLAGSCSTLRLLRPVAASLGLFSPLVVDEDAREALIVLVSVALLSPSCLWVER
jgi:hypothetical protein